MFSVYEEGTDTTRAESAVPEVWPLDTEILDEIYLHIYEDKSYQRVSLSLPISINKQCRVVPNTLNYLFPTVELFVSHFTHIELASKSFVSRAWVCYSLSAQDYIMETQKRFNFPTSIYSLGILMFHLRSGNATEVEDDAKYFYPRLVFVL